MSGAPIRAAGASGRPQCRPSSTAPTWRATNRTRRERRDGSPPQSRSGGHPPRQIDRLSDQVATSTGKQPSPHDADRTDVADEASLLHGAAAMRSNDAGDVEKRRRDADQLAKLTSGTESRRISIRAPRL